MKLKDAYSLEGKLWQTYIVYWKAETLLCQQRSVLSRLWFFLWSCMDVRVGLWRRLSAKELMLLNCGVGEDSLDLKEIQPVHSERDQPWDFFGRNDAKAETPVLWPPDVKSWLIGQDSDAGRDWGQEEKGTTEDEMAGWYHWLYGRESEWTLGVGDGQGGLACCDSWGRKESDTTERLIWSDLNGLVVFPTFFNLCLNLAIRSSWSEPQSAPSLVFADCIELLHLWLQKI